jgi:copper chaperone CopZ
MIPLGGEESAKESAMRSHVIAIIHLREPATPVIRTIIEPMLRLVRGVADVQFEPAESLITVAFDGDQTGLADIVRMVEDLGMPVAGVAQRRAGLLGAA